MNTRKTKREDLHLPKYDVFDRNVFLQPGAQLLNRTAGKQLSGGSRGVKELGRYYREAVESLFTGRDAVCASQISCDRRRVKYLRIKYKLLGGFCIYPTHVRKEP